MKVKAFTIYELLVAMFVGGIAILLIIVIYLNFQKVSMRIQQRVSNNTFMLLDYNRFIKDFDEAATIYFDDDLLIMDFYNNSSIQYEVKSSNFIRIDEELIDTLQFHFEGLDIECLSSKSDIVESVQFEIVNNERKLNTFLYKNYSNSLLMNTSMNFHNEE